MKNRRWLMIAMLTLILVACSPSLGSSTACSTNDPVPVSEEAAARFESKVHEAFFAGGGGSLSLEATSTEVTSYLALYAPDFAVSEPQIRFLPQSFCASGTSAVLGPVNARFSVAGSASLSEDTPSVTLEAARMGPLPVPGFLLGTVETQINDQLGNLPADVTVTELRLEADRIVIRLTR